MMRNLPTPDFNTTITNPLEELQHLVIGEINTIYPELGGDFKLVLESPPPHIHADYSFAVYTLSMRIKQDKKEIAENIASAILRTRHHLITAVDVVGPYVNVVINKSRFSEQALLYIQKRGDQFGVEYLSHEPSMVISYLSSQNTVPDGIETSRMLWTGGIIGRLASKNGTKVTHEWYGSDIASFDLLPHTDFLITPHIRSNFSSLGEKLVAETLRKGKAAYIPGSRAVFLDFNGTPFVLQKHSGQIANIAQDIAYIQDTVARNSPTRIISVSLQKEADDMRAVFDCARYLECLASDIAYSATTIRIPIEESNSVIDPNTPAGTHRNSETQYSDTLNEEGRLFDLTKTLLLFPRVLHIVQHSFEPNELFSFLSKLELKSRQLHMGPEVISTVQHILEEGYRYLGLQFPDKKLMNF